MDPNGTIKITYNGRLQISSTRCTFNLKNSRHNKPFGKQIARNFEDKEILLYGDTCSAASCDLQIKHSGNKLYMTLHDLRCNYYAIMFSIFASMIDYPSRYTIREV